MTDIIYGKKDAEDSEPLFSEWWRTVDRLALFAVLILFIIGLLLCMASSPPLAENNGISPFYYVKKQLFFVILSFFLIIFFSMISVKNSRRIAVVCFILSFTLILFLPFFGTDFGKGAVRWFSIFSFSIQPSEFLKPFFIIFSAWLISGSLEKTGPPGKLISFLIMTIIVTLLISQPDFGQATLIITTWSIIYFISGASIFILIIILFMCINLAIIAYFNSEHVANRLNGFISPDLDPLTQLGYATNAIKNGGFLGVGVGDGKVKWKLPDAHTDFIIAVAAEEYGLLLCLIILSIFLFIIVRSLYRLIEEPSNFVKFAGTGLVSLLGLQTLINVGVAVRLLPAKGLTLPFISYGGSSVLAMGILMGFLLSYTRKRPKHEMQQIFRK